MKTNKLVSLILSIAIVCSASGCSDKYKRNDSSIKTESSTFYDNGIKGNLQNRMISFIEKIEASGLDLDLTNFYENAKTLKISVQDIGPSKYASYNIDDNEIVLNYDSDEGFEHEILHVVFANRTTGVSGLIDKQNRGVALNEGITELITNELLNNSKKTYFFDTGITKIFSIILGKDVIFNAINQHDNKIIINALAETKATTEDAKQYLEHWDYAHFLLNKMHEEYFTTGSIENFKTTSDYTSLKLNRIDLVSRLKIYVKEYYKNKIYNTDINPYVELTNMLTVLDIFNNDLFSADIEVTTANDFFLKEEVQYLVSKYRITEEEYLSCVSNTKTKLFLKAQVLEPSSPHK